MRKPAMATIALILILLAALFLSDAKPAPEGAAEPAQGSPQISFGIYPSAIADSASGNVAALRLYLFPEGAGDEVAYFCSQKPIQKNILILKHASAPGVSPGLAEEVSRELSRCGFSSRAAGLDDALSSEDSVIIAPTGAVPSGLAENRQELLAKNNRVIVLESLAGRRINADGRMFAANESAGFETVGFGPGSDAQAAFAAARSAIMPNPGTVERIGNASGNFTVAAPVSGTAAHCRAIYSDWKEGGPCRVADTGEIYRDSGTLAGPAGIVAGRAANFEFSPAGSEDGRQLEFHAGAYLGGKELEREGIQGGMMTEGWASRFSLAFPSAGNYRVEVSDQFGRRHAVFYAEVSGLEIIPVSAIGNRYEFRAELGGKPVSGPVSARIDNGTAKEFVAANGALVVWAAPAAGRRTMTFEYGQARGKYSFVSEGSGMLDAYARWGVPALVFLFAVYFFLRAAKKAKYEIVFPHFASQPSEIVSAGGREIAQAWEIADRKLGGHWLPAYPEEIGRGFVEMRGRGKEAQINAHSMLRALRELSNRGMFLESEGLFVPASAAGGFPAHELRTLRLMHDILLERGIAFRKRSVIPAGSGLEIALFRGKESVLGKLGMAARIVVFESEWAMKSFVNSLGGPEEEDVRIKLAVANGKVVLAPATRSGLEAVIPQGIAS